MAFWFETVVWVRCSKLTVVGALGQGVSMNELLNAEELVKQLNGVSGWEISKGALVKVFKFGSYLKGVDFARKCGEIAEEMNHHPDLLIQWRKVRVSISTHSAGGVTGLDFEYAKQVGS